MGKKIAPLRPEEIIKDLDTIIPSPIILAINNLLKLSYRHGSAKIKLKDIIAEAIRLDDKLTETEMYEKKWLDFENLFEAYGWIVTYDKPGYDETYDSYFIFKKKD